MMMIVSWIAAVEYFRTYIEVCSVLPKQNNIAIIS
jgi:hypothetical protein